MYGADRKTVLFSMFASMEEEHLIKMVVTLWSIWHHRLYDTKDHIATHIARKIANYTTEVTDPTLQHAEAN